MSKIAWSTGIASTDATFVVGAVERSGDDNISGHSHEHAPLLGAVDKPAGLFHPVWLGEGGADLMPLCEKHRVGHAAAEQQRVDAAEQMLQHGELVGHFRPAKDGDEGPLRIVQEPRERGLLPL